MKGYDFFRDETTKLPRTPFAALRALEEGIGRAEAFVYLSTSIRPLEEEPIDLNELSRILAKSNTDFETRLVLIRTLKKLSRDIDVERALFGSESITVMESRYTRQIDSLKKANKIKPKASVLFELATLHYELSALHAENDVLKRFHLNRTYRYMRGLLSRPARTPSLAEVSLAARTLLYLGIPAQAAAIVEDHGASLGKNALYLRAEIAYYEKDYFLVYKLLGLLSSSDALPDQESEKIAAYWFGKV